MQPLLLVQPPIEHSRAQLEDLADRLIVGARLRPDDWPILVVAVERVISEIPASPPGGHALTHPALVLFLCFRVWPRRGLPQAISPLFFFFSPSPPPKS